MTKKAAERKHSTRLNLDLSEQARARLERIREQLDAPTMTDVVRRALALFESVLDNEQAGGKTILRDKDGAERLVVIA